MKTKLLLVLVATLWSLTFLTIDSWQRWGAIDFVNRAPIRPVQVQPERDATTVSGYQWNQHNQILPYYVDCYNWIQQTQLMTATGDWRVRHVEYDRVPGGRDVHWSGSIRWWLALLAWVDSRIEGTPFPLAVEHVAPWAGPLLLGLAICGFTTLVYRRFGAIPAAFTALAMVSAFDFYQNFAVGNPDHHGLVSLCCFATVLLLIAGGAGWVRIESDSDKDSRPMSLSLRWRPDRRGARRWFIASGIAGGTGLWISSATIVPVLLGLGVGAVAANGWLARRAADAHAVPGSISATTQCEPFLWVEWSVAGAFTSLAYYLLEYFPGHFGWRLEVNHPLYALAWLGGGTTIWLMCAWLGRRLPPRSPRLVFTWIGAIAALAALPVAVMLTHARTFYVADPFLWALHVNYIAEFQSFYQYLRQVPSGYVLLSVCVLPLISLALIRLVLDAGLNRAAQAMLLLAIGPGLVMTGLACKQVRWLGIADAIWLAGAVALLWIAFTPGTGFAWSRRRGAALGLFGFLLVVPMQIASQDNWFRRPSPMPPDYFQAVTRDVAHWLRQRVGGADVTVLSGPSASSMLVYHGGFRAEGTLYWENIEGLRDAAAIFSATTPAAARQLLRAHGIGYIVIVSADAFDEQYTRLYRGVKGAEPTPDNAFILQIVRSHQLPKWLRPLPYPSQELPHVNAMPDFFIGVFEVVPDQNDEVAGVRNAQFLLEIGQPEAARTHLDIALQAHPDYVPALVTLARLPGEDPSAYRTQILAQLFLAPKLEWSDRVELGLLLEALHHPREAQVQFAACWADATEARIRALRSEACYGMLGAARRFGLTPARPELRALAYRLLPDQLGIKLLFEDALAEHLSGRITAAVVLYQQALERDPNFASALNNLAMIRAAARDAALRNGAEAVALAERAARLDQGRAPGTLDTLACACAEAGDYVRAEKFARRGEAYARAAGNLSLAEEIGAHARLFAARQPFRDR